MPLCNSCYRVLDIVHLGMIKHIQCLLRLYSNYQSIRIKLRELLCLIWYLRHNLMGLRKLSQVNRLIGLCTLKSFSMPPYLVTKRLGIHLRLV